MTGIFISRGMTIAVPVGGLTITFGHDGKPNANLKLHVRFDVCSTWCELALRHLADARSRCADRIVAWAGTNEDYKATSLEREFEASMQAIMAAATALDAFYSVIQTHVNRRRCLWSSGAPREPHGTRKSLRFCVADFT